jgi:hypothetical protein
MKIIRKQFSNNSEVLTKIVINSSASQNDWRKLVEKCRNKCSCSHYGMPHMTVWSNKINMRSRTGHHFQFELVH